MSKKAATSSRKDKFPGDWGVVALQDVVTDFISGGTPSTKKPEYWNGEIPWTTSSKINGFYVNAGEKTISKEGLENSATNIVPRNNLLIATRVGVGKIAVNEIDVAISQDLTGAIIDTEKVLPDYLCWAFLSSKVQNIVKNLVRGSTIKGIARSELVKVKIPLSPLSEQRKIAEVLSTADEAISKVNEAIEKTQRIKKGLMQKLLTKGIGRNTKVNKLGRVITGKTPSTSNKNYWNGHVPFITPADIGADKYVYRTERSVSNQGARVTTVLPKDSVLSVCIGSTIGKIAMTYQESITNQQINAIICAKNINPHYVYYALTLKSAKMRAFSGVAAVPIIKKSLFEQFEIELPSLQEQNKIAEILGAVDRRLELLREKKATFERIKKGLMNDLLTGRKRVKLEA